MNFPPPMDILVLTDLHYTEQARHACPAPARKSSLALDLTRKALARLRADGIEPQLILLLGDLVDNGDAPDARRDLERLAGAILSTGIRTLAVPGNHDGDPSWVSSLFDSAPGLHIVNGYGFLLFHDRRVDGDLFARPQDPLDLPARVAADHPGMPLIALQHNPLHPRIDSRYPYMLQNGEKVLNSLSRSGVCLALSGHAHRGQPAHRHQGVTYCTVPALTEHPFEFLHLRLEGTRNTIRTHRLAVETAGLCDVHCHTEFAYCATSVNAGKNIALARALGLGKLCLTEHAFHLYLPREQAWGYQWQNERDIIARVWESDPRRGRMAAYRAFAQSLRGEDIRLGLEVDLMAEGQLLLHPDDQSGWDLLVGAIHAIDGNGKGFDTPRRTKRLFMRDLERLLEHPIQVLAHPFRYFVRAGQPRPVELYRPVARMLAVQDVAAEINCHGNRPDPIFVRACLEEGTRLALGSDSHDLNEVAEMSPHLRLLREAGLRDEELAAHLYAPA